ncbi:MAG: four helix bundle protein [Patescibacteria group bacterium]
MNTKAAYALWHKYLVNLKRIDRYTIGTKIDETFLELLEFIFRSCFAYDKFEKVAMISSAIGKSDLVKFELQIAWETDVIENKIYGQLILHLEHIGRMLGGWKKSAGEKTHPTHTNK